MSDHIDLTFLKQFSKEDPVRMKKYIDMFVSMAPGQIEKMKTSLATKDWPSLKTAAHSMKPQLSYMGIGAVKQVILDIQDNAADQKNLDNLPDLITTLETEVDHALVELREAMEDLG